MDALAEKTILEAATRILQSRLNLFRFIQNYLPSTWNAMKGDRERCLAAGMDDYITKPINTDLLYAALKRSMAADKTEKG